MTPDRTRHLAEAVLAEQGWNVYRLTIRADGPAPPALIVTRDGLEPVVVAVAQASEPKGNGGPYPRFERAAGCHALASVTAAGRVRFYSPARRRRGRVQLGAVLSGRLERFEAHRQVNPYADGARAPVGAPPAG